MAFQFPSEIAYSLVVSTRQAYRDAEVLEATASVARDAAYKRDGRVVERCEAEAVWGSAYVHLCTAADNHAEAEESYHCLQETEAEAARLNPDGWQALLAASFRQLRLASYISEENDLSRHEEGWDVFHGNSLGALMDCVESLKRDSAVNRYSAQSLLEGGAL